MYLGDMKKYKGLYKTFIAVLFIIAETYKNKTKQIVKTQSSSTDEWINQGTFLQWNTVPHTKEFNY